MRARFTFGALGLSAAALIALGAATASGAATTGKTVTFHLIEKDDGLQLHRQPAEAGAEGPPLIGDQIAFSSELLTKTGAHAGWLEATCMVARGGTRGEGPCYGVFRLAGGTLMAMAVIDVLRELLRTESSWWGARASTRALPARSSRCRRPRARTPTRSRCTGRSASGAG